MTESEILKRKILLKWQYYELLMEEISKTYRDILNMMIDNERLTVKPDFNRGKFKEEA